MNVLIISSLSDTNIAKLKASQPSWQFTVNHDPDQNAIDHSDIIIGNPSRRYHLHNDRLKAIMLNSAGNDGYIEEGVLSPRTILTNASGSYGIAISEHTIGMMLSYNKHFDVHYRQKQTHTWRMQTCGRELYGSTVLIVGYGDIGYQIAKRLQAFQCRIIGLKRRPASLPYCDVLDTIDHLEQYLKEADYIIMCLPHTKETCHMINHERIMMMKEGAVLVNVGRGSAIDTTALREGLHHHLGGALLDVVEGEPIDANHPLWQEERVMITSHSAGGYHWPSVQSYFTDLVIRNMAHLAQGEPLENEVSHVTGYRKDVIYRD